MTQQEFQHECIAIKHANFKLGHFVELNIWLAQEAATVQTQDDYEILTQGSANMDLVCNQLITNELN